VDLSSALLALDNQRFIISDWFAALLAIARNDGFFQPNRKSLFGAKNYSNLEFFGNMID